MKDTNDKIRAVLEVLKSTGVDILEAALVAKEALAAGRGRVKRARACIQAGEEEMRRRERTVTFARAVEAALEARRDRRARTVVDFRYICNRFMKRCKGLAQRRVRAITPEECAAYLREAFGTPQQRNKARRILSGVFSTAYKRGWCAENPVRRVEAERVVENRIEILSAEEIERLMTAAREYEGGKCLAAVGMMLYGGIRPHEVERLRWEDVRLEDGVICISPQHSKTGGARHVTIQPPLKPLLCKAQKPPHARICPPNWRRRWAGLHRAARFTRWRQDVLRHTFATQHLSAHRNYAELQLEMGHRSADLLRTRYIAMQPQGKHEGKYEGRGTKDEVSKAPARSTRRDDLRITMHELKKRRKTLTIKR